MRRAFRYGPRALLIGAGAALLTPLWTTRRGMQHLLAPPRRARQRADQTDAARVAVAVLYRLARLKPGPWSATCLYRSIAACLAMRADGGAARLVLGARVREGSVEAHAWIEHAAGEAEAGFSVLNPYEIAA